MALQLHSKTLDLNEHFLILSITILLQFLRILEIYTTVYN